MAYVYFTLAFLYLIFIQTFSNSVVCSWVEISFTKVSVLRAISFELVSKWLIRNFSNISRSRPGSINHFENEGKSRKVQNTNRNLNYSFVVIGVYIKVTIQTYQTLWWERSFCGLFCDIFSHVLCQKWQMSVSTDKGGMSHWATLARPRPLSETNIVCVWKWCCFYADCQYHFEPTKL